MKKKAVYNLKMKTQKKMKKEMNQNKKQNLMKKWNQNQQFKVIKLNNKKMIKWKKVKFKTIIIFFLLMKVKEVGK